MELETVEINSTVDGLKKFKESIQWKDVIRELEAWCLGFDFELDKIVDDAASDNPTAASVLMRLGDLNGRKKAVQYMMSIPDVLISIKQEEVEDAND